MDAGYNSKMTRLKAELEEARENAFRPLEYMNRKARRTKEGRILERGCIAQLHHDVAIILRKYEMQNYGIDTSTPTEVKEVA